MTLTPSRPDNRRSTARRLASTLALLAAFTLGLMALSADRASAVPEEGSFSAVLGAGKAGKKLKKSGVRFSAIQPSSQKRLSGKRVRVRSDLKSFDEKGGVYVLRGGFKFSKGKRSLGFRKLGVDLSSKPGRIKATVGGKRVSVFAVNGKPRIDEAAGTMRLKSASLKLNNRSAGMIKRKLRVKRPPAGQVGSLAAAVSYAFEDPYLGMCNIPATTRSVGTVPEATTPDLTGAVATLGEPVTWGFKASFNGYVNGIGNIQVLDGAVMNPIPFAPPPPIAPPGSFTFPFSPGEYAANGAGDADDQAVLNGTGSVMYCNEPHGFRIVIANPTVVIDGESSKVIADVDTNISGDWRPTQRVDLAELDFSKVEITPGAGEVSWKFPDEPVRPPAAPTYSAVTLSETGSEALRLCEINVPGAPPQCIYPPGTLLDDLMVTASFPEAP